MNTAHVTRGYTLIEVLVVMAILILVVRISFLTFSNMSSKASREAGVSELYGALVDARTKTLSAEHDTTYGVHMSSTTITRFSGSSYVQGSASNKVYRLDGLLRATSTIIDADGTAVMFNRFTGKPTATGTIYMYIEGESDMSAIQIHNSGLIEYD